MNKTIEQVYEEYKNYISIKNKITTNENIKEKFKNQILPFMGKISIYDITPQDYINFQTYLKSLNYSYSTYKQIHIICKRFFDYLNSMYGIENIPLKVGKIENYDIKASNQTKGTFTKKEFNKFINSVDDKTYHALFNVLFYCGLRKGEALALKISDFKNNSLYINKSITKNRFNGERQILTPKTKKSNRIIRLDYFTSRELKRLIKYYNKTFNNFNNNFFLFGGDKPIACTTLERKKNHYCKKAGVKQIRIHDFRHSHATMLYKNNVKIKLIQERLGHSDIDTTLNTYIHTDERQEKRLTKLINLLHF